MLYDNALLALAYLEAYQVTQKSFYAQVAREIFTYLLGDMRAPDGGFASAEDADSEGGEGRHYTWRRDQVCAVLGNEEAELFTRYFDITRKGNFGTGLNIPNLLGSKAGTLRIAGRRTEERTESDNADSSYDAEDMLIQACACLLEARTKRPRPFRDDRVLTAWNGLSVTAFARGGRVLGEHEYVDVAADTADFVLTTLRRSDGRLLARYRKGEAAIPAYLDDYAFFIR